MVTLYDCSSATGYAAQGIAESGFLHLMLFGGLIFSVDVDEECGLEEWAVTCVIESCKSKRRMKEKTHIGL
ncbi:pentatricopeptide repeat-containing protein [Pyrus ussuriensis x Pyrus communis]|uniref:Pentatricopeptide repeat-containing protein n=1 Tax=Pyrus ussuriensis x Pyrus communis TaxID=2448454 RepID=A0A5N5FF35_9ROSA|nr:pentatricopeptide repeat-containing protein [Pyrus ussuriensis x Pyrus communis]